MKSWTCFLLRNSARGSQLQAFAFILLEHRASKININTLKEKDIGTLSLPSAAPPNTVTIGTYRAGGLYISITRSILFTTILHLWFHGTSSKSMWQLARNFCLKKKKKKIPKNRSQVEASHATWLSQASGLSSSRLQGNCGMTRDFI